MPIDNPKLQEYYDQQDNIGSVKLGKLKEITQTVQTPQPENDLTFSPRTNRSNHRLHNSFERNQSRTPEKGKHIHFKQSDVHDFVPEIDECSIKSDYDMVSDLFDFQMLQAKHDFGIKRYKKMLYKGQIDMDSGNRHGMGVNIYDDGRFYEGQWLMDKRAGQGFEQWGNGNKYVGDYMNNKAHGKGLYTWNNGETYDGEFVQGKKNGFGTWKGIHEEFYMGQWKNNRPCGYGVHQWKNGDKYEGEWKEGLKNGQGTDTFANLDTYNGLYKDGKPNGYGSYRWSSGACYVGEFLAGKKHGKGKWMKDEQRPDCNQYQGEYQNDMKHGKGTFNWESGNKYVGEYMFDQRHGYGEMFWKDGTWYKGDWVNGMQHGQGSIQLPGGKIKTGKFENNVYISKMQQAVNDRLKNMFAEKMKGGLFGGLLNNQTPGATTQNEKDKPKIDFGSIKQKLQEAKKREQSNEQEERMQQQQSPSIGGTPQKQNVLLGDLLKSMKRTDQKIESSPIKKEQEKPSILNLLGNKQQPASTKLEDGAAQKSESSETEDDGEKSPTVSELKRQMEEKKQQRDKKKKEAENEKENKKREKSDQKKKPLYVPPPAPKPFKPEKKIKKYDYQFGLETEARAKVDRKRPEKERVLPTVMKAKKIERPSSESPDSTHRSNSTQKVQPKPKKPVSVEKKKVEKKSPEKVEPKPPKNPVIKKPSPDKKKVDKKPVPPKANNQSKTNDKPKKKVTIQQPENNPIESSKNVSEEEEDEEQVKQQESSLERTKSEEHQEIQEDEDEQEDEQEDKQEEKSDEGQSKDEKTNKISTKNQKEEKSNKIPIKDEKDKKQNKVPTNNEKEQKSKKVSSKKEKEVNKPIEKKVEIKKDQDKNPAVKKEEKVKEQSQKEKVKKEDKKVSEKKEEKIKELSKEEQIKKEDNKVSETKEELLFEKQERKAPVNIPLNKDSNKLPPKRPVQNSEEKLIEDTFEITKTPNDENNEKHESIKSEVGIPDVSESYHESVQNETVSEQDKTSSVHIEESVPDEKLTEVDKKELEVVDKSVQKTPTPRKPKPQLSMSSIKLPTVEQLQKKNIEPQTQKEMKTSGTDPDPPKSKVILVQTETPPGKEVINSGTDPKPQVKQVEEGNQTITPPKKETQNSGTDPQPQQTSAILTQTDTPVKTELKNIATDIQTPDNKVTTVQTIPQAVKDIVNSATDPLTPAEHREILVQTTTPPKKDMTNSGTETLPPAKQIEIAAQTMKRETMNSSTDPLPPNKTSVKDIQTDYISETKLMELKKPQQKEVDTQTPKYKDQFPIKMNQDHLDQIKEQEKQIQLLQKQLQDKPSYVMPLTKQETPVSQILPPNVLSAKNSEEDQQLTFQNKNKEFNDTQPQIQIKQDNIIIEQDIKSNPITKTDTHQNISSRIGYNQIQSQQRKTPSPLNDANSSEVNSSYIRPFKFNQNASQPSQAGESKGSDIDHLEKKFDYHYSNAKKLPKLETLEDIRQQQKSESSPLLIKKIQNNPNLKIKTNNENGIDFFNKPDSPKSYHKSIQPEISGSPTFQKKHQKMISDYSTIPIEMRGNHKKHYSGIKNVLQNSNEAISTSIPSPTGQTLRSHYRNQVNVSMPAINKNLLNSERKNNDLGNSYNQKPSDVGLALQIHQQTTMRGLQIGKSYQSEIGSNRVKKDKKGNFLPPIRQARSQHPNEVYDESASDSYSEQQMKRASKRAIQLIMRNMQKNNKRVAAWVPSGRQNHNTLNLK